MLAIGMLYRPSKLEQPGKSISWLNIDIVSQVCGSEVFSILIQKRLGEFKNCESFQQNNSLLDNLFVISTNVLMCPQSVEGGMPHVNDPFEHGCAFQRIFPLHSSQSSKNALISGA